MTLHRRSVLSLLGLGGLSLLSARRASGFSTASPAAARDGVRPPFPPVRMPLPVETDGLSATEQQSVYRAMVVDDRLTVPQGFSAALLAAWGDPLGESRFGFNNDHLGFVQHSADRATMTVNFEYISAVPWEQGFMEVVGRPLPFAALVKELASVDGVIDCTALPSDDPQLARIRSVADEAMTDLGLGVMTLKRDAGGNWVRARGLQDRRITGITGLEDPSQRLASTGPAVAVFQMAGRMGYDDGLGSTIVGSFANCGGGTTPWGTVLSAEENIQTQVTEAVHADGSSAPPSQRPFLCRQGKLRGLGNVYGLAGNKYGWMVELDPDDPDQVAHKHTARPLPPRGGGGAGGGRSAPAGVFRLRPSRWASLPICEQWPRTQHQRQEQFQIVRGW